MTTPLDEQPYARSYVPPPTEAEPQPEAEAPVSAAPSAKPEAGASEGGGGSLGQDVLEAALTPAFYLGAGPFAPIVQGPAQLAFGRIMEPAERARRREVLVGELERRVVEKAERRLDGLGAQVDAERQRLLGPDGAAARAELRAPLKAAVELKRQIEQVQAEQVLLVVGASGDSPGHAAWTGTPRPRHTLTELTEQKAQLERALGALIQAHPALGALDLSDVDPEIADPVLQSKLRTGFADADRAIEDVRAELRAGDIEPLDLAPLVQAALHDMGVSREKAEAGNEMSALLLGALEDRETVEQVLDFAIDGAALAIGVATFFVSGPLLAGAVALGVAASATSAARAFSHYEEQQGLFEAADAGLVHDSGLVDREDAESARNWAAAEAVIAVVDVAGATKAGKAAVSAARVAREARVGAKLADGVAASSRRLADDVANTQPVRAAVVPDGIRPTDTTAVRPAVQGGPPASRAGAVVIDERVAQAPVRPQKLHPAFDGGAPRRAPRPEGLERTLRDGVPARPGRHVAEPDTVPDGVRAPRTADPSDARTLVDFEPGPRAATPRAPDWGPATDPARSADWATRPQASDAPDGWGAPTRTMQRPVPSRAAPPAPARRGRARPQPEPSAAPKQARLRTDADPASTRAQPRGSAAPSADTRARARKPEPAPTRAKPERPANPRPEASARPDVAPSPWLPRADAPLPPEVRGHLEQVGSSHVARLRATLEPDVLREAVLQHDPRALARVSAKLPEEQFGYLVVRLEPEALTELAFDADRLDLYRGMPIWALKHEVDVVIQAPPMPRFLEAFDAAERARAQESLRRSVEALELSDPRRRLEMFRSRRPA